MNYKRAIGFGVISWVFIFVLISILIFVPLLKEKGILMYIAYWILFIPLILLLAKWYFKKDSPTFKKGFLLGIIGLFVGSVLDLLITIPLFISQQSEHPFVDFYTDWRLYIGFLLFLILTTYAGYEFDRTYTERDMRSLKSED